MNLNSKEAAKAWKDYKGFLEGMGIEANKFAVEQAFKIGYAKGVAEAPAQVLPPLDATPTAQVLEQRAAAAEIKATNYRRTEKEIKNDAEIVKALLQRVGRPMRLQEITQAVNNAGGHWYPKSGTGHIAKVMDIYPTIKKVGFGLYEYQG